MINSIDHILLYVPEMLSCLDNTISCIMINTILLIFIYVTFVLCSYCYIFDISNLQYSKVNLLFNNQV